MNEIKIQIPESCELIKDGDTYIVKEKKQGPPRSWEEFCERYPVRPEEAFIDNYSVIDDDIAGGDEVDRDILDQKNLCSSKEEAEAFLALMQLRQLRKAWVGDWKSTEKGTAYGIISKKDGSIETGFYDSIQRNMLFPTREMAEDFLNCFRDLCETAKILL